MPAYRTAIRMFEEQRATSERRPRLARPLDRAVGRRRSRGRARERAEGPGHRDRCVKSDDLSWRADVRLGEAFRKLSKPDEARQSFQDAVTTIDRLAADAPVEPRGAPSARRQRQRVERPGARARLAGRRPGRAGRRRGAPRPHPPRPARWLPARHHARHHAGRTRRGTGYRPRTDFDERPAHGRALGRKARPRAARQAAAAARDAGGEARRSAGASLCAPARAPAVARACAGVHRLAGPDLDSLGAMFVEYLVVGRGAAGRDHRARRDRSGDRRDAHAAQAPRPRRQDRAGDAGRGAAGSGGVAEEGDAAGGGAARPDCRDAPRSRPHRGRARRRAVEAPVRGAAGRRRGPVVARARHLCDLAGDAGRRARHPRAPAVGSPRRGHRRRPRHPGGDSRAGRADLAGMEGARRGGVAGRGRARWRPRTATPRRSRRRPTRTRRPSARCSKRPTSCTSSRRCRCRVRRRSSPRCCSAAAPTRRTTMDDGKRASGSI